MFNKILYPLILILVFGCNKKTDDDLGGTSKITGRLYIQNIYDSVPKKLIGNHHLFIRKDTSTAPTSFLFSTISDGQGYYTFDFLKKQHYKIYSDSVLNTRLDTDILFCADSVFNHDTTSELILGPDFKKQNALYIKCIDILGGTVPGDSIYIYSSKVLATADSATITGTGATYKFTSRFDGTAFKMNLPFEGELYINTANTFGNIRLTSKLVVLTMEEFGFHPLTLTLSK